jgi:hypothetical protein
VKSDALLKLRQGETFQNRHSPYMFISSHGLKVLERRLPAG